MSLTVPLEEIFADKGGLLANHESWERVELDKVCSILNGFPFKSKLFSKDSGFPVIRIRDLCKNTTETFYNGEMPKEFVIKDGDFLIGMDGMFRCVKWQGGRAGLNQRVCKIVPNEQFLAPKFLLYGLNGYLKAIEDVTSSVTVGHLSSRDILKIPFPLPPRSEQDRIVAKLEVALGKLEASQKRLTKIPIILKRFRQSVLAAACSGRLTADWRENNTGSASAIEIIKKINAVREKPLNMSEAITNEIPDLPSNWVSTCLGYAYFDSQNGISKRKGEAGKPLVVLRLADITDGRVNSIEKRSILLTALELNKYQLFANDILVVRVNGSPELCGRFIHIQADGSWTYCDHFIRLRTDSRLINSKYLCCFAESQVARNYIREEMVSSAGQNTVSQGTVFHTPLALPPTEEQNEIVRRVESFFALADQIEARFRKAKAQVEKLTPSILAKAFRGELVPQDPNDEPASELLKRIQER